MLQSSSSVFASTLNALKSPALHFGVLYPQIRNQVLGCETCPTGTLTGKKMDSADFLTCGNGAQYTILLQEADGDLAAYENAVNNQMISRGTDSAVKKAIQDAAKAHVVRLEKMGYVEEAGNDGPKIQFTRKYHQEGILAQAQALQDA